MTDDRTRVCIERDNVKLSVEYSGINQLTVDEMLEMFKGILQGCTFDKWGFGS